MRIGYKVYNNTIQQIRTKDEIRGDKIQTKPENQYRQHFKNLDGSIIQSNGTDTLQLSKETVEALKKAQENETSDLKKSITGDYSNKE